MTELEAAINAAKTAGAFLKENFYLEKAVHEESQHDVKIELDLQTQKMIEDDLFEKFPEYAFFGEEGITGAVDSPNQWIVDPIDGTVNYFYGIPHFCVSIALRQAGELTVGVIYDPMMDELWAVQKGEKATLNGKVIHCSPRAEMEKCIVFVGHGSTRQAMETGLTRFNSIAKDARKMRITGSAALAMAYISCGRYDAYIEGRISLWDIAAGKLLVEAGGGVVKLEEHPTEPDKLVIAASNGQLPLENYLS